jgi:hypothetical protein
MQYRHTLGIIQTVFVLLILVLLLLLPLPLLLVPLLRLVFLLVFLFLARLVVNKRIASFCYDFAILLYDIYKKFL